MVSSSLDAPGMYREPKTKSVELSFNKLCIIFNSLDKNDPSALNIQKYSVFTLFIPSISASPYPLFFWYKI